MKKKRYIRTVACIALGAILLTGSALANFDNASGYTKLKNGMLSMRTMENFTAQADISISYNGSTINNFGLEYMYDRSGKATQYAKDSTSSETWTQDGYSISRNPDSEDHMYYVSNASDKGFNDNYLSGTDEAKKSEDKTYSFLELLCDTLVGDLKNNFVLLSSENGGSTYQISLTQDQIPELLQSGFSLLFNSSYSNYSFVYEDGEYSNYTEDDWEKTYEEAEKLMEAHDYEGVAYIKKDGSIEYYASKSEYLATTGYENITASDLQDLFADAPNVDIASCTVTMDSEGRITEFKGSLTLTGKDAQGNEQSVSIDVNAKIYDYGTTTIEPFDTSILKYDWNQDELDNYGSIPFDADGNKVSYDYEGDETGGEAVVTHVIDEEAAEE